MNLFIGSALLAAGFIGGAFMFYKLIMRNINI